MTELVLALLSALSATPAWGDAPEALLAQDTSRVVLELAPGANRARYRVREQLAGMEFPNDAVGETASVRGAIVLNPDGTLDVEASRIEVDLTSIASDSERRDNYIRRNTFRTSEHPILVLVPTVVRGLPNPLPSTGRHRFTLVGELHLKGGVYPTAWEVEATFDHGAIQGHASTVFTFQNVGLEKPSVGLVLRVADDIRLELDFQVVPTEFP